MKSPHRPALLLITERFSPDLGGVARSAQRTANSLNLLGVDVHVLAWSRSIQPGEVRSEIFGGVTVHRLGLFAHWDLSLQHSLNVLDWLHEKVHFMAAWGHYLFPAGFLAVMFAGLHGLPSTVSARGNDIDRLMFPPGDFSRLLWTLERATVVSTVSRDLANKVRVLLGQQAKPEICVLPNVVESTVFKPAVTGDESTALREKLGIRPDEAVLGFCGELRHKKGLSFLLAALAEVRRRRPVCLLVIGDVRPREQAEITSFAAIEPDAGSRIIVTGHVDEPTVVAQSMRLCDVCLQPSVWDGMPNAVLEAMACERIVIASDAGGIPEMIEHGRDGFLIPKAQLHRLGQAVLDVLSLSPEERALIGRAARQRVLQEFNAEQERERLRLVIERLQFELV